MSPNWQPHNLGNDSVKLVPLKETDFEAVYKVASDPLIWEQHPAYDRYKEEVFRKFFEDALFTKTAFLIIDKESNAVIGSTRFYDYDPGNSAIVAGYTFLARQFWGGETNRNVKKLMLEYAFQFVDTVIFHIGNTNTRSIKAMEKTGGVKVKEVQYNSNGQPTAHLEFHITKDRWQ